MNRVIDALQTEENKSEKQWPDGINKDLILESSLSNPFVSQVMKHTWLAYVRKDEEILSKRIEQLKRDIGISPIYDLVFTIKELDGTKYKPVAKKVVLVSAQDPDADIPSYKDIQIGELSDLPVQPKQMEELKFMK